jgi:pimeloyl-ACP methyl ester carboxylesterase
MMRRLGHEQFTVAGHDRGALYAFRAAAGVPESVTSAVIMDALPVSEHLDRCDARFATAYWHCVERAQMLGRAGANARSTGRKCSAALSGSFCSRVRCNGQRVLPWERPA